MAANQTLLHGTCVAISGRAALLRGASGSGKSDLALRFLSRYGAEGALLVADDQVQVTVAHGRLIATAPATIAGQIEVRGIGIVSVPHCIQAELHLLVDLCDGAEVPRLPPDPPQREHLLSVAIPRIKLTPFEGSAAAKLKLALTGGL